MLSTCLPAIGKRYLGNTPQSKVRTCRCGLISVLNFDFRIRYHQGYQRVLSNRMVYPALSIWKYYSITFLEIENSRV